MDLAKMLEQLIWGVQRKRKGRQAEDLTAYVETSEAKIMKL